MNWKNSGWVLAGVLGVACVLGGCRQAEEASGDGSAAVDRKAPRGGDSGSQVAPKADNGGGEEPSKLAREVGRKADGRKAPAPARPPRPEYRAGVPIPGKPGFIFNPFTNNPVDVRGIPPGTLVRDPADPDPDHKFRTPPAGTKPSGNGNGGLSEIPVPEIP